MTEATAQQLAAAAIELELAVKRAQGKLALAQAELSGALSAYAAACRRIAESEETTPVMERAPDGGFRPATLRGTPPPVPQAAFRKR